MPINGHPPDVDRPFRPRYCSACRPKPDRPGDHASCRYAYGCECWCWAGRAHEFPMKETP